MSSRPEPAQGPDWAVQHARAALAVGQDVATIEKGLVARGLTPAAAAGVVTGVLEERVRGQSHPLEAGERAELLHRVLSGAVVCGCILLGYWFGGGLAAAKTVLWVLGPLACVWFPYSWTKRTPAAFIRWGGWVVLLLIGGRWTLLLSAAR